MAAARPWADGSGMLLEDLVELLVARGVAKLLQAAANHVGVDTHAGDLCLELAMAAEDAGRAKFGADICLDAIIIGPTSFCMGVQTKEDHAYAGAGLFNQVCGACGRVKPGPPIARPVPPPEPLVADVAGYLRVEGEFLIYKPPETHWVCTNCDMRNMVQPLPPPAT